MKVVVYDVAAGTVQEETLQIGGSIVFTTPEGAVLANVVLVSDNEMQIFASSLHRTHQPSYGSTK